jgi:hypothetical protein
MLSKKDQRMSLTYRSKLIALKKKYVSYLSYSTLLNVKGHFKSLSQTNTASVSIVLSIDIPTQMEPSFISEKCKFWAKNNVMY